MSFLLLLAMAALGLAALFQLTEYSRSRAKLSYSRFMENLTSGRIKKVNVVGQSVAGALVNGKRFETVLPNTNWNEWEKAPNKVDVEYEQPNSTTASWPWLIILGILLFVGMLWFLFRQSRSSGSSGGTIFSMGKSRAKMVVPTQINLSFDDVAGAEEAKQELTDIVAFLKNPEHFKRLGARLPSGVLLVGEPGNGKTLLAKAVAGQANCPFFMVNGSDFVEVFVGVGAARIRDLFAQARKHSPCIIFIDEIDAIGRQRGTGLGGGNDEREQTLNQLLTELDGFTRSPMPIIVIAATNIPEVLDKALLRPGRFDRRITVPFPDAGAREDILKIHTRSMQLGEDVELANIAEDTAGFSGADLENLANLAALSASKKQQDTITGEDFEEARLKIFNSIRSHNTSSATQGRGNMRARLFMPQQIKTTFADVAGMPEAKEEVVDIVDFLTNPEKFKRVGAKIPRGVLLAGEPGNGKTLLAKAIAGEANRPFFSISGSDFVEMFVGVGASRVRELFAQARKHAPSIIFIDEIDAVGGERSAYGLRNDERDQTLNQLLSEMDGFETGGEDVIVIGATNRADMLDKALLRPGRFDRKVIVPYPDIKARAEILAVHAKNVRLADDIDLQRIARGTPGFSGADLASLINEAAIIASKADKLIVELADLDEARDKIIMGKQMRSVVMSPRELEITAYHEAGHAMVRLLMPEVTEPLFKVTILPRGSSLGATHWLPEREKYMTTKEEMLASIMSALGGRIAEEICFNVLATGASNDFQHATEIARRMVTVYGMSESLGPVSYREREGHKEFSADTARKIDEEIRSILQQCYDKTRVLLEQHREMLEKLAKKLLEQETMHAEEIYELLGIEPRASVSIS